jgi:rhodanese-related sulfurtransferase
MNYDYLLIALLVVYIGWRLWSSYRARQRMPELKREGAQLVDVRSPGEFASGHAPGSVNIPLQELDSRAKELDSSRWVVVACASGTRSAMAARKLQRLGFSQVMNAGSWRNLG